MKKNFKNILRIGAGYSKKLILTLGILGLTSIVYGNASTTTRSSCKWFSKKYVTQAHVSSFLILYNQWKNDSHCTSAQSVANGNLYCSFAAAGNSASSSWINTWSNAWYCGAGNEYELPETAPANPDGFSRCEFNQQVMIHGGLGNGIIKIKNIEGLMSVATNTDFSSFYRIVIWMPADNEELGFQDTLITPKKMLWEASVRIESGEVITTGGFTGEEFDLIVTEDSMYNAVSGLQEVFMVKRIQPKNIPGQGKKINKTLFLDDIINEVMLNNPNDIDPEVLANVTIDQIAVTVIGSSGFGKFRDDLYPNSEPKSQIVGNYGTSDDKMSEPFFNVYPNPVSTNNFQIELYGGGDNSVKVEIMDAGGRLVYVETYAVSEDDITTLNVAIDNVPNGVYFVSVVNDYATLRKKIIISK